MKKTVKTKPVPSPTAKPLAENVQACQRAYGNVYDMVVAAARRSRELAQGSAPMVQPKNHKPCVVALLEVEQGKVNADYFNK